MGSSGINKMQWLLLALTEQLLLAWMMEGWAFGMAVKWRWDGRRAMYRLP